MMIKFSEFGWLIPYDKANESVAALEKPVIISGVKINPGCMVFKNAYDRKNFKQTLTITNISKHSVNIRIFPSTSKAFQFKPLPTGQNLSPGLTIVRHIKYSFVKATAIPQACFDIFINNHCFRYGLLVHTALIQVEVFPKSIDFGEIDIGSISKSKQFVIANTGTKQALYSIDLGRNSFPVTVEPMKGIIQPGDANDLTVRVFGTEEGEFNEEFWIKTEPLQRIHIKGKFIKPGLVIDYPLADRTLSILAFPMTFLGVPQELSVVIQNRSSSSGVVCIVGNVNGEMLPYEQATKKDWNFKQFQITPLEARLHTNQKYILGIRFEPQKSITKAAYFIINVVIKAKKCQENGNPCKIQTTLPNKEIPSMTPALYPLDIISAVSVDENVYKGLQLEPLFLDEDVVLLIYAELEIPKITIVPDKLYFGSLNVFKTYTQTIKFTNNSKTLPLIMKYVHKTPNIEIIPKETYLPPNETVEIIFKLCPTRVGEYKIGVALDVFFPKTKFKLINIKSIELEVYFKGLLTEELKLKRSIKPKFLPGITPTNCNEVGYLVDHVKFNSQLAMPRGAVVDRPKLIFNENNNALIAFPNDRPTTLRPWRNPVTCKTIFAQLPRVITSIDDATDLSPKQQIWKNQSKSYYIKYLRQFKLSKPYSESELEDYETTDKRKILMEYWNKGTCKSVLKNKQLKHNPFVPLTPYEIHNIVVTPQFIQLGSLAVDSASSSQFNVQNKNPFPVHISIKAPYSSLIFKQEEFLLDPGSSNNIDFTYRSSHGGTHHIPMFIIMNFFHVIDFTVLATIVSNSIQSLNKNICIVPTEKTTFLELYNPINSDVSFSVDAKFFHLDSFPDKGIIPARRKMVITVTFNPEFGYIPVKEIAVISESGYKVLIEVNFDHKKAEIAISSETLVFKNIPLNTEVTQELIISNKSDQLIPVNIEFIEDESFAELVISPIETFIRQKGSTVVRFTLKFQEVVQFKLPINLTFQNEFRRQITIIGNVLCPSVSFKPEFIKTPKIPCGCIITIPFRLYNNSTIFNRILFLMEDWPQFTIRNKLGTKISDKIIDLSPKQKMDLLLEFHPQETVAYCIYLPYILNEILGPPEFNCPESLKSDYYLTPEPNKYKKSQNSLEKLKTLKILCTSSKAWLQFSQLEMEFSTFGECSKVFEVRNVSSYTQELIFDLKYLTNFILEPLKENLAIVEEVSIKADLKPEETLTLLIKFESSMKNYGEFAEQVPIIVKQYSESVAYNYLKLTGINPEPNIKCEVKWVYFTPAEIGCRQEQNINLELFAHRCDKRLEMTCNCNELDISMKSQIDISNTHSLIEYSVVFLAKKECIIETEVTFSCSCSMSITVEIFACGDRSLIINFMSEKSIINSSTYPFFPMENDQSAYASLLRNLVPSIERWLYTQGFYCQYFYKLPDDIARYSVEITEEKMKPLLGKMTYPLLPLVQLLVNLMDKSILKYIDSGSVPVQDLKESSAYKYATYRNTLSFLKSQKIKVPGLKPEHLLTYPEYIEYKRNTNELTNILSEDNFYRFSKQKWLDLFFHIYKVLVLERTVNSQNPQIELLNKDTQEFEEYVEANLYRFPSSYFCDAKLLLWLEFHYNRQKTVLWPNYTFESVQLINDFTQVDDSVPLATITAVYCPYLKEFLNDVYACAKTVEQRIHNACRVVQAWKTLKLSLDIHPQTIVKSSKIKIIFIVTYLYEVLPHFYPNDEVVIEAPLSQSNSYNLHIQNCGDDSIQYNTIFFGENSYLFKVECGNITIPSHKTKSLTLTYYAKRNLNASAILVCSGEIGGQRYAKSMAINVIGVPKTTSSQEIELKVDTYLPCERQIKLKSPYGKNYIAEMYICFEEPKSFQDVYAVSFLKRNLIPREIDFDSTKCEFFEKEETLLSLYTFSVSRGECYFYLYFCNNEVGDFCVLIRLTSNPNRDCVDNLDVTARDFKMPCTCRESLNLYCPKTFTVTIPSRNLYLWGATVNMIENCFTESKVAVMRPYYCKN
ncbi:hypothetical protein ABEB36_007982 [Hypothenemus hampei]|uniref:HYDIN/VesB/CFA65-like Ig-like domain-containing protein n=1 Tax=Hypothenemus hampei TaxID=57062 RepID=A0ABD1EKS9_HYPHA